MSPWLLALAAGAALALLQYGWRRTHQGPLWVTAAILRWVAATLVVALLLDAPSGPAQPVRRWAALDVSQSMAREDTVLWRAAMDSVRAAQPESTLWFGDSTRVAAGGARIPTPMDKKSELRSLSDRAVAAGHPIVLVTDGELSDAEVVQLKYHLEHCPPCEDRYRFQADLKRLVRVCCEQDRAPTELREKLRQILF